MIAGRFRSPWYLNSGGRPDLGTVATLNLSGAEKKDANYEIME